VQEGPDVEAGEIVGATAEIEGQPPPLGRHRHPTADREAVMAVAVAQTGRLAFRRPGPAHGGDQQKAALIDEDEMGATSCGVFLSAASRAASTGRWRPRPVPRRGARASGNSSRGRSAPSRRGWGDSESRTLGESLRRSARASRHRSGSPLSAGPAPGASRVSAFGPRTGAGVVRAWAWAAAPAAPHADTLATTETPNSPTPRAVEPPRTTSGRPSRTERHVDGASPTDRECQMVACPIGCSGEPTILPLFLQTQ